MKEIDISACQAYIKNKLGGDLDYNELEYEIDDIMN